MSLKTPFLFSLSASHRAAPLELRERLALPAERASAFGEQVAAAGTVREFAVLNTCNRVEFYGVADDPRGAADLEAAFCRFQGIPEETFRSVRALSEGPASIAHLVSVAAGLESQMLGENEIFGQVKDAYAAAQERRSVGPVLNRVFQKAFQAAKHVRTHTAITEGQVSVANVAVDLALKIFGRLDDTRVLLIGAGDIGEKTAKAFQSRGARALTVCSRTLERAMALATEFGASALPFEIFPSRLSDYDVVVCSTAAPHAVVSAQAVAEAVTRRPAQPLFLIDLALPRDVEPAVAEVENVYVYNLDDLAAIADENRKAREAEVGRARRIAEERAAQIWRAVEAAGAGRNGDAA